MRMRMCMCARKVSRDEGTLAKEKRQWLPAVYRGILESITAEAEDGVSATDPRRSRPGVSRQMESDGLIWLHTHPESVVAREEERKRGEGGMKQGRGGRLYIDEIDNASARDDQKALPCRVRRQI